MIDELIRYLHLIAVFVLVGAVVIENIAFKPSITREDVTNLSKVNAALGISAALALIFGVLLWFVVGKPADYYNLNPIFHIKMTLFVLLGVVTIFPSKFLRKWRSSGPDEQIIQVPKKVILLVRLQLLLAIVIPILATLMARGIGLNG